MSAVPSSYSSSKNGVIGDSAFRDQNQQSIDSAELNRLNGVWPRVYILLKGAIYVTCNRQMANCEREGSEAESISGKALRMYTLVI